jgi:hypothetical protein
MAFLPALFEAEIPSLPMKMLMGHGSIVVILSALTNLLTENSVPQLTVTSKTAISRESPHK